VTLGHEFVGIVDELGSEVTSFKIGQRVVVDPNSGCDKCDHCHSANYHFCKFGRVNTIGIFRNGGWATHAIVPETQVRARDLFTERSAARSRFFSPCEAIESNINLLNGAAFDVAADETELMHPTLGASHPG